MKIGLFGGTFDPVHHGHLILAERVREVAGLDEVWFLPSYAPPHKTGQAITRFDARVEMCQLAIVGQTKFRVETIEKELPAPSYTLRTVQALQEKNPDAQFALIVGADTLPEFPSWYEPQALLAFVSLIAVPRPSNLTWTAEQLATALNLTTSQVSLQLVESPLIEIASRDLRQRVHATQTIRYLVPRAVEEYIREKKLYA